jgi:hypothetical protein
MGNLHCSAIHFSNTSATLENMARMRNICRIYIARFCIIIYIGIRIQNLVTELSVPSYLGDRYDHAYSIVQLMSVSYQDIDRQNIM